MDNIKRRCIDVFNRDGNYLYVCVPDLYKFLKKNFEPKLKQYTCKADLIEMAKEHLNEQTVDIFAEKLDRFGLTSKQVIEILELDSHYVLDKMVKEGTIREIAVYKHQPKTLKKIFSMSDVFTATLPEIRQVEVPDMTDENLEDAVYLINKSAKVSRDTKNRSFEEENHRQVQSSKTRSLNLYYLKDETLKKLIQENKLAYVGIHEQECNDDIYYLKLYRGKKHEFHIPIDFPEDGEKIIGKISGEISAEKTKEIDMTFKQAVKLLESYTNVKASGTYNKKPKKYYDLY